MKDSIIYSALRSFISALALIFGLMLGVVVFSSVIAAIAGDGATNLEYKSHFRPQIVANGDNVRKKISDSAPVILRVSIKGVVGLDHLTDSSVHQLLIESRENLLKKDRVKAVLVHINTPGGTVTDADGIYRLLKEYKTQYNVPVFAYVDGLCASGGMYIASACDKILCSKTSLVGSVGVITPPFFNVVGLMEKLGIESKTLSAGKGKDDFNPFRAWKPTEEDAMRAIMDYYYNQFVDIVIAARPEVAKTTLINDIGAKVLPAEKAFDIGLVDSFDTSLNDAYKTVAKEIGIEDDYYQVVEFQKKFSLSDLSSSPFVTGKVKHEQQLMPEIDSRLANQFLYMWQPNY